MESNIKINPEILVTFGTRLLVEGGFSDAVAEVIARHLVEAERIGRATHGLCNVPVYIEELRQGRINAFGDISCERLNGLLKVEGRNSSGIWAVETVLADLICMAKTNAVTISTISAVHHTGCMAVYLRRAIESGMILLMCSSNPVARQVVPHGAQQAQLSTNPIAFGAPAGNGSLMLDMATSMVSGSLVRDFRDAGNKLPGNWVADEFGRPSSDSGYGNLLPLGAPAHGYKGTGLSLMIEALTQGLSGWGRSTGPQGWQQAVFLVVFNPEFFGGREAFEREIGHTLRVIRASDPVDPGESVRTPGDRSAVRYRQSANSVEIGNVTFSDLKTLAQQLGVPVPDAIGN